MLTIDGHFYARAALCTATGPSHMACVLEWSRMRQSVGFLGHGPKPIRTQITIENRRPTPNAKRVYGNALERGRYLRRTRIGIPIKSTQVGTEVEPARCGLDQRRRAYHDYGLQLDSC